MGTTDEGPFGSSGERVRLALPGSHDRMAEARRRIGVAARSDAPVLLLGETGTGKTRVARCLHEVSRRSEGPYRQVNCAGVPEALFESQFFGHRKGAFTGAVGDHPGHFSAADGGTLFLDEVGELPAGMQAKLLTAIEEQEFRPVGGRDSIRVDLRLVAATSAERIGAGSGRGLRRDLYHRLAVVVVRLPPLRARLDDLPVLVDSIMRELEVRVGRKGIALKSGCLDVLSSYDWPGNLRELAHILQTALLLGGRRLIDPGEIRALLDEERARGPELSEPSRPARSSDS